VHTALRVTAGMLVMVKKHRWSTQERRVAHWEKDCALSLPTRVVWWDTRPPLPPSSSRFTVGSPFVRPSFPLSGRL